MKYLDEIKYIAKSNGGYIYTFQLEEIGISRPMIRKYVDIGELEQASWGMYMVADIMPDEFVFVQKHCDKAVFSYGTALYLWELSDRVPHTLEVTVPQGTHTSHLRKLNEDTKCHYVKSDLYNIGITSTVSPQGGKVYLYDKERCICDIIRNRDKIETQLYTQAIKGYFRGEGNYRKLLKYAKAFNIEDKVRTYIEVLM